MMMLKTLTGLAAGMGLLLSPDHLRLWGNLAGNLGHGFWLIAIVAAIIYALSAISYGRLTHAATTGGGYLEGLQKHTGTASVALALASRLTLTLGISTGVLVTAGFVFNETFVYWFPNFSFAFIVLALVAIVHIRGYAAAEKLQIALLAIALSGLLVLIASGFWGFDRALVPDTVAPSPIGLPAIFSGLLLFVGFDLGIHRGQPSRDFVNGTTIMIGVLGIMVIWLSLWGTVSLAFVPAERLAVTTIPYTLAARGIAGQTGRALMGVVVIAGTGCALLALFSATSRLISSMAQGDLLPRGFQGSTRRGILTTSVMAATIAAMMALGFAGEPALEVFIRSGFLLWLLHLAMVNLAAFKLSTSISRTETNANAGHRFWLGLPGGIVVGSGALYLWITDAERIRLSTFMFSAWFGCVGVLFLYRLIASRTRPLPV